MVLQIIQLFSIPEHAPKIKRGIKTQTTRRGIREIQMGTVLQQYCKTEMNNFLGEVPVTEVIHYPFGLQELNKTDFENWAVADGFESGEQAEEWFTTQYGIGWRAFPMTVIKWDNRKRVLK